MSSVPPLLRYRLVLGLYHSRGRQPPPGAPADWSDKICIAGTRRRPAHTYSRQATARLFFRRGATSRRSWQTLRSGRPMARFTPGSVSPEARWRTLCAMSATSSSAALSTAPPLQPAQQGLLLMTVAPASFDTRPALCSGAPPARKSPWPTDTVRSPTRSPRLPLATPPVLRRSEKAASGPPPSTSTPSTAAQNVLSVLFTKHTSCWPSSVASDMCTSSPSCGAAIVVVAGVPPTEVYTISTLAGSSLRAQLPVTTCLFVTMVPRATTTPLPHESTPCRSTRRSPTTFCAAPVGMTVVGPPLRDSLGVPPAIAPQSPSRPKSVRQLKITINSPAFHRTAPHTRPMLLFSLAAPSPSPSPSEHPPSSTTPPFMFSMHLQSLSQNSPPGLA